MFHVSEGGSHILIKKLKQNEINSKRLSSLEIGL